MKPTEVYDLTPREFELLMQAQQERKYDEYEYEANIALMREQAHRTKRPKVSDIFKRPSQGISEEMVKEKAELIKHAQQWLSQWTITEKGGN